MDQNYKGDEIKEEEGTTTVDIAGYDAKLKLKKKKTKLQEEAEMEEELVYHLDSSTHAETMVIPNGEYIYLDYLNNITYSFNGTEFELTNLQTGEIVAINPDEIVYLDNRDCEAAVPCGSIGKMTVQTEYAYNAYKEDLTALEKHNILITSIFPESNYQDLDYSDYKMLKEFYDHARSYRELWVSKNQLVQYRPSLKDILIGHGNDDTKQTIDFETYMVIDSETKKTTPLADFADANLWPEADILVNIVKNSVNMGE